MQTQRVNYKIQWINETAGKIKAAGYRVFLSESREYGFYTDKNGTKVVSFQTDLSGIPFSGNYKTSKPMTTGTGWRIADNDNGNYRKMFNAMPPSWAVHDSQWSFTTLEQHLKTYQKSSRYSEI